MTGGTFATDYFLIHHESLEQFFTTILVKEAPDIVHVNHLKSLSPRFVEIARELDIPVVISLHDFYFACPLVHLQKPTGELCAGPDFGRECARTCFAHEERTDPTFRWGTRALYFRRLLGLAERLIAGSRYVASFFEDFASRPGEIEVIPNGVDMAPTAISGGLQSDSERETLNLAYCGTVVPVKGPHVILQALKIANLPSVDLLLLGQTPNKNYLAQLRDQAAPIRGLKLRVHGAFERDEFPTLLKDVDCVVVPSLVPEAGPQVPREALALGIPVIASRLGGLPEIVENEKNGLIFDPTRPHEFVVILQRLVRERQLLARLRSGARQTPVMTVALHARAVRSLYENVIEHASEPEPGNAVSLSEFRFLHRAMLNLGFGVRPMVTPPVAVVRETPVDSFRRFKLSAAKS
jgi:glycosyltransferase involved in cell wall biosynthesis